MKLKHSTASTFVFCQRPAGWRIGLIFHPLLRRSMLPGGHVEQHESSGEAALREIAEEAGLAVRLVPPQAPPVPEGVASIRLRVHQPWWIFEHPAPADNHVDAPHIDVDHLYVAVAEDPVSRTKPAHPFGWHSLGDLPGLDMFPDTRMLAEALFRDTELLAAMSHSG